MGFFFSPFYVFPSSRSLRLSTFRGRRGGQNSLFFFVLFSGSFVICRLCLCHLCHLSRIYQYLYHPGFSFVTVAMGWVGLDWIGLGQVGLDTQHGNDVVGVWM
jgi:hypothetical protein